jgi:flavin reductase (DIM6/NTAB) family NADH-FMN oxidoreductase RutF
VSKADLFDIGRGDLEQAPMIKHCPVSMGLKLKDALVLGHHEIFVGEIAAAYAQENRLTEKKPDLEKIDPILFEMMKLGCWSLRHLSDPLASRLPGYPKGGRISPWAW